MENKENPTDPFQFTITHILVITAVCAVSLGVGTWTGDFVVLPTLIFVNLLLVLKTRGRIAPGLLLGFAIAILLFLKETITIAYGITTVTFSFNSWIGLVTYGSLSAAIGASIHSIVRGHKALGCSILVVLGLLLSLLFTYAPQTKKGDKSNKINQDTKTSDFLNV